MPTEERVLPRWVSEHLPAELADSSLFRFKIILNKDNTLSVDMLQDIDIDYEHLEHQAEKMPAQYAFWAAMYSEVKFQTSVIERKVKHRRGFLTKTMLDTAKNVGVKPTDKQVANVLEQDQELDDLEMAFLRLQRNTGKLYHMVEAVKMKSELLRTLSGFKRLELETQR